MRTDIHHYTLRRPNGATRQGALLRIDGGYADVHPWPELGDAPLDEQLALLARGQTTPLTRASLHLAALDRDARRRGVSLFEGLTIPESHWPGNDPPSGFDTVKTKGVLPVPDHVRIRIDFNATLSAEEFTRIAERLPKERIDFIEDPCPYDATVWRDLQRRTQLRLALDRFIGDADVLVHKPALSVEFPRVEVVSGREDREEPIAAGRAHAEIVVTSYMDHPVGQFGAAYVAATHDVAARCGLMTHVLYEPDAFIERIERDGARLLPPRGTGIGFDDLLESLPWTSIG